MEKKNHLTEETPRRTMLRFDRYLPLVECKMEGEKNTKLQNNTKVHKKTLDRLIDLETSH